MHSGVKNEDGTYSADFSESKPKIGVDFKQAEEVKGRGRESFEKTGLMKRNGEDKKVSTNARDKNHKQPAGFRFITKQQASDLRKKEKLKTTSKPLDGTSY